MIKWVRIKKFCACSGYTEDAVRMMIGSGQWIERMHWLLAPDGKVMMNSRAHLKTLKNNTFEAASDKEFVQLLSIIRNAARGVELPSGPGVYFLFNGKELQYVGQSKEMKRRIGQHMSAQKIQFNRFAWISCPVEDMARIETMYIYLFQPPLNQKGLDS